MPNGSTEAAADHLHANAVRHRPEHRRQRRRRARRSARRRLHRRPAGHPRAVQVRGRVRDAAAACATARTRRPSTRARTPTTRSNGCSPTCAGHNGRVGMVGTSYPAWLAVMGALDPHPALAAIVQQASPADMWLGDDFHHNGAFRLSYGLEYAYMMESSKEITSPATLIDRYDTYEWYLELGSLANANRRYFQRVASKLERLRPSSRLRRLLEAAGVRAVAEPRHRADAQRGWLVGSGGLLRSHQDLRAARASRHQG